MNTFDEINDATGFANGDKFHSEQQVRDYFTVANMVDMDLVAHVEGGKPALISAVSKLTIAVQDNLDKMAQQVIANEWHCAF